MEKDTSDLAVEIILLSTDSADSRFWHGWYMIVSVTSTGRTNGITVKPVLSGHTK